ncbi:ABC transporter permease [Phyllobacterium phragmitis]|uniref:ABC transporter permease n=1 Tax=Phyllobacterium phragmitis TaxID=2670329 RepID=A0A2S9IT26_9HYPH|nr:ABC transporter permease [Phyllobacterium phragmitis]PRD43682.1 ABC transporter permease [Phyllobacterium phragmitis]
MVRYLLIRLLRAFITITLVVTFAFIVLRVSGDPAISIMGDNASPEAMAAFRKEWGLDQSIFIQYFNYVTAIFQGDFGHSMRGGGPALDLVVSRIPATVMLTLPALLLKVAIGVPAGIYAALHHDKSLDRTVMVTAVAGYTVPSFVLGLLLVQIFALWMPLLPTGGTGELSHLILPVLTLGIGGAAILARFVRSAMLEVLGQPYIRTANAKGIPWGAVVRAHALPNAAIPTVTIIGFMVGSLIAGSVVTESVFSWPGVGNLLVVSVTARDLSVVQCILLLVAATMVLSNMFVDILYGILDPRLSNANSEGR